MESLPPPSPVPYPADGNAQAGRQQSTVSVTAFRALVAAVAVLVVGGVATAAFLSGRHSQDQAAPAPAPVVTAVPVVAPASSAVPAARPTATRTAKPRASTRTVYIKPRSNQAYGSGFGTPYGTFSLTGLAYPGPIHAYADPTDRSAKLYPIHPYETVTVYCFVRGQRLNGHDYWDWTGDGWVWDQMVDIGGHSPPACVGD